MISNRPYAATSSNGGEYRTASRGMNATGVARIDPRALARLWMLESIVGRGTPASLAHSYSGLPKNLSSHSSDSRISSGRGML